MSSKIRVIIADDSSFICSLLTSYLQSDPEIEVVGVAKNGKEAVERVKELRPDVITLDLEMPIMSGLEAIDKIMTETPIPTIVITGVSKQEANTTLEAINLGAVDFIFKYVPGLNLNPKELFREIILKVKAAAKTKLIRSLRNKLKDANSLTKNNSPSKSTLLKVEPSSKQFLSESYLPGGVVVIGASTGGPIAIRELLAELPDTFPSAILVVQHIPVSFTKVLAAQLNQQVPMEVKEAQEGDKLKASQVLVAPGGSHMIITPDSQIKLTSGIEIESHIPSIDVTMQAVAQVYGRLTKGVLLTGMGKDGSQGLLTIHSKGGTTFAQSAETCVVNGMPQSAIELKVVDHIASPKDIAALLVKQLLSVIKFNISTKENLNI
ncbi:MAG: chemotaxis-specific protein-glutamate methyltransferase CheB [Acidobacteria bacterium]|nr:chemotaxis-specific protein-glutamate methyltransferase CheB [Acidobacteriota bacterium]